MNDYRPTFSEQKFRNLVLYITKREASDRTFGKVKLWKTLWLSDFLAYSRLGEAITGADYVHMPQGPGPTKGDQILKRLENSKQLVMQNEPLATLTILHPIALVDPEPVDEWLTASQLEIVEEVIRQFAGGTAADASSWAHDNSVGWRLTQSGDRIPYETVFLSPEFPNADDEQWAREAADRSLA